MDINLPSLKKIDIKIRYLIFGFVRKSQQLLFYYNKYNLNISELISYIILSYYHHVEYFRYFNKKFYQTSNNKKIITKLSGKAGTCYGAINILYENDGIHTYRLKIIHLNSGCCIGIDEHTNGKFINSYFYKSKTKFYAYSGFNGKKYSFHEMGLEFGSKFGAGDIVEMIIDLNDKSLLFSVNDNESMKAFKIEPTEKGYYMFVCLGYKDDKVELLSYTYTPRKNQKIFKTVQ